MFCNSKLSFRLGSRCTWKGQKWQLTSQKCPGYTKLKVIKNTQTNLSRHMKRMISSLKVTDPRFRQIIVTQVTRSFIDIVLNRKKNNFFFASSIWQYMNPVESVLFWFVIVIVVADSYNPKYWNEKKNNFPWVFFLMFVLNAFCFYFII